MDQMMQDAERVYAASRELEAIALGLPDPLRSLIEARSAGMRDAVTIFLQKTQDGGE